MGRATGSKHASTSAFNGVFGTRRGGGDRPDVAPLPVTPVVATAVLSSGREIELPFRTVQRASERREFERADVRVIVCERCGNEDFLLRSWEAKGVPAMCPSCHEDLRTEIVENHDLACEDWCTAPLGHMGLCDT